MRRIAWGMVFVLTAMLLLAGCGTKDAGAVVKDLNNTVDKLESYEGTGRMVLHSGQQPQEYQVEVWYQSPHYYRISLTNDKKDITQIVLRNDDGVYVLTPHLNKIFRFQSDWPDNQGQVYLYQSLVQSILADKERQFTTEENAFVFDVLANYANASLARQKIWLDKKSFAPRHVEVADANANVMVSVDFNHFEFNKKFDKDAFDMQRNMTASRLQELPTLSQENAKASEAQKQAAGPQQPAKTEPGKTGTEQKSGAAEPGKTGTGQKSGAAEPGKTGTEQKSGAAEPGKTATEQKSGAAEPGKTTTEQKSGAAEPSKTGSTSGQASAQQTATPPKSTIVIDPMYTPKGTKMTEMGEVKLGGEVGVIQRYSGSYNYTLLQSRPVVQAASSLTGSVVDLGFSFGVLYGDSQKTLQWMYEGVEFRLTSGDLPSDEMVKIAQSVQGQVGK
ncbi:hypothetical protein J31TS4_32250 [Paenibacillus sp. J31TS4]|uniref:hypothetical protein n=1 Tax=Paenibacillus sp. J31TS4 TaxID=2807195 RepID=UPI001B1360EE|nr:hypothetical protein [Paenibacillus sp. J31TS4]GIP39945.1 hypothetical protein J31TS4_32250 [Paenibacillus sp. J31TS4]